MTGQLCRWQSSITGKELVL
uniref:Uncharacterized protein n=1 Tax=Anguilla anguilla TaxID=7936 RepID=A0A0E9Y0D2_ANGAN